MANEMIYGNGSNSSIEATGKSQIRQDFFDKKAVIDIQDEM